MAINPEERKRLRQEAAQKRQEAAKQRRAIYIRLSVAAAILLVCGIVIFLVSRGKPATVPTNPSGQTGESLETTAPPVTSVHLAFGGDLNITDNVVAAGGAGYDYTPCFLDVAHLFADADLAALNFEGVLGGTPYGSEGNGSAPQEVAQALSRAGVDLIQLANSCSLNQGLSGLEATINNARAAGLEPLGAYANRAAYNAGKGYVIRNVGDIKIAFVAFTKGMDGLTLPAGSEDCVNLLYTDYDSAYQTIDTQGITSILDAAKREKPDVIIAMLHWGSEFNDTVSSSQANIVTLLQENGVDAIIGTHSHYVQKIAYDPAAGSLVAYCLGDLLGDADRSGSEYSIILDLEITKDAESGDAKISDYSYTPIYTVHEEGQPLRVVRLNEAIEAYENGYMEAVSQQTYESMVYALSRIEARVTGE